ncbi:PepSY domain-containing protein [Neiella marina]|uniref:PepSY domain-containing protein n=1 Tax=Neiella holothuriorum TaxID=2870530 RepID=A0ABS7EE59_9GAMM|nr:PepSY-associated TM helix domain-containing protein [Neiella holothuriorum]MBW8190629.1 PepSY domain-containing protein [Neiella holothuriorum]
MRVRSDILRTYQNIHTWTGILSGLLLFIGFYAGSLTMFQQQIDQWATPPAQHLPMVEHDQMQLLVDKVLAEHPNAANAMTLHLDGSKSPITWYEQGEPRELSLNDVLWHATLDDSNQLVAEQIPANALSAMIDYLHRSAGILGELGHDHVGVYLLGIASVLYFIALISGVIFLLPTLVKSFFALRTKKGANRFWLDSHNLVGIGSLPFHLMIAFTVVVFAFHDFFYGGLKVLIYGDQPMFPRLAPSEIAYQLDDMPSIETILDEALSYDASYQPVQIDLQGLNGQRPLVGVQMASETAMMRGPITDYIMLNPYTFDIYGSSFRTNEDGLWERMVATFFAMHFGSFGGDLGRWLYFFMGLAGAFLFYSGNLLWLEKRRNKTQQQQSSAVTIMAKLTVGVSLGSIAGVVLCLAATKWLVPLSLNINHAYMWLYYTSFLVGIAFAFGFRPIVAAVHLQRIIAVLCLAIPLTSLVGWVMPQLGPWPSIDAASLGVDFTSLIFAALFWWGATKTQARGNNGEPNSIWAR